MDEDFSISEDGEDGEEGAGSSSSSEEEVKKVLPQRKSRGTRRVQTVQEGDEDADEEFWAQGAWKEEENDDDIKSDEFSSGAFGDSSDSDIDYDETADVLAEEKAAANAERVANRSNKAVVDDDADAARKKSKYVDPALVAKRTRKPSEPAPVKRKRKPAPQIPQEDMLAEVVKTEHENKRILAEMILLQEAAKTKREALRKADDKTPRVVFTSSAKRGDRYSYSDPSTFPKAKTLPPPPRRLATAVPRYRFLGAMNQTFTNLAEYQQLVQQKAAAQAERAAAAQAAAQAAATPTPPPPAAVLSPISDNLS